MGDKLITWSSSVEVWSLSYSPGSVLSTFQYSNRATDLSFATDAKWTHMFC